MGLSTREQVRYWGIVGVAVAMTLWFLGDVLLPFVLGIAIAYLLDPVVDRMERVGLSRILAVAVITAGTVVVFAISALLVIPTLFFEIVALIKTLPQFLLDLQAAVEERFPQFNDRTQPVRQALQTIGEFFRNRSGEVISALLGSARSLLDMTVLVLITPVVTVYLLFDWDRMIASIDTLLPRDHAATVRQLARDIDATLSSFVRGMLSVCFLLGIYYAIALTAVGLNFGLAVGFIAGLITFIPYLGALFGGVLAIGLALFQFWGDWGTIALVALIFVFGQFVEGNILTPKLVGKSVNLHPAWLLLALSVFGALFGFVGILLAVPLAATLGVIARFFAGEYRKGRLYQGFSGEPEDDDG